MKARAVVGWVASALLAVVFLAAAIPKIENPHDFALAVFRYRILPYSLVNLMAIFLPWVELIAAVALLWPGAPRRGASLVTMGLLLVFTAAMILNWVRGIDIACGCFTVDPAAQHATAWNVVRNALLLVLAGCSMWSEVQRVKQQRP